MIAYKFLATGAVAPFTGFSWPVPTGRTPGRWVDAPDGRPEHGVHACRERDLAFWLDAELWRAELVDPVADGQRQVIARRGRLVERVAGWNASAATRFAETCIWRARDRSVEALHATAPREADRLARCSSLSGLHAVAETLDATHPAGALAGYLAESIDFLTAGDAPCSAYISARSAVVAAGGEERAFAEEREQQGFLLARHLGLGA